MCFNDTLLSANADKKLKEHMAMKVIIIIGWGRRDGGNKSLTGEEELIYESELIKSI